MFAKTINRFDKPLVVACDGKCEKAWGICNRPQVQLDPEEPDDSYYLADGELGDAPKHSPDSEGGDMKPQNATSGADMNKWCIRACERSEIKAPGIAISLTDFSHRMYNMPSRHLENVATRNMSLPPEMPVPFDRLLAAGRTAYDAFCEALDEVGDRQHWYELSEKEQQAWCAVASRVSKLLSEVR